VVNLFKQNVVSQKKIFLLPWHHSTIIFVDSLTIFTAQIAHSHTYWGKLCLHSLADQNVHRVEKIFSTKYHAKATWVVLLDPLEIGTKNQKFLENLKLFRLIHFIAAVTVYLPVWHWHCTRASFTVPVSCNGEIAVRSYLLLWLPRQVAKLSSGLFYGWSLLLSNNKAINFQSFTSSYCSRRFSACDQGPTGGFPPRSAWFSRPGCLSLIMKNCVKSILNDTFITTTMCSIIKRYLYITVFAWAYQVRMYAYRMKQNVFNRLNILI